MCKTLFLSDSVSHAIIKMNAYCCIINNKSTHLFQELLCLVYSDKKKCTILCPNCRQASVASPWWTCVYKWLVNVPKMKG